MFFLERTNETANEAVYFAVTSATATDAIVPYCGVVIDYTVRTGIMSQALCETIRQKIFVFERPPKMKKLTIWQRLAKEEEVSPSDP